MTPAEQIKAARISRGLSQAQAAKAAGVPLRTLQEWEQNRRTPPEYTLRAVLTALEPADSST